MKDPDGVRTVSYLDPFFNICEEFQIAQTGNFDDIGGKELVFILTTWFLIGLSLMVSMVMHTLQSSVWNTLISSRLFDVLEASTSFSFHFGSGSLLCTMAFGEWPRVKHATRTATCRS